MGTTTSQPALRLVCSRSLEKWVLSGQSLWLYRRRAREANRPGANEPSGFILTTILGIVGAFVATFLGRRSAGTRPVKVLASLERLLALSSCFWFGVLLLAGEVAPFPD